MDKSANHIAEIMINGNTMGLIETTSHDEAVFRRTAGNSIAWPSADPDGGIRNSEDEKIILS